MKPYTMPEPTFKLNDHDVDGDIVDECIFLCFENVHIKVAKDLNEFKEMMRRINEKLLPELERVYAIRYGEQIRREEGAK